MTKRWLIQGIGWALSAVLAATGIRLGALMVDETLGIQRWEDARYEPSRAAFARTQRLNVVSPWIADFNVGTAHYKLGDFPAAVDDFQRAIERVPRQQYCMVALNLSWSWEALGDSQSAGGDAAGAEQSWIQAKAALDGAQCGGESNASGQSEEQQQDETQERLQRKLDDSADDTQDSEGDKHEQLEQRQQEAQSENQQSQESGASDQGNEERTW